jgi:hypothetical protein
MQLPITQIFMETFPPSAIVGWDVRAINLLVYGMKRELQKSNDGIKKVPLRLLARSLVDLCFEFGPALYFLEIY